jgi:hypothetical protein
MIAKAKNEKAFGFDRHRARGICALLVVGKVLAAVQLDYQSSSVTQEVGDIIFDRDLAPEASACQAMVT